MRPSIKWDETNLAENEEEKEAAQRTKILEPKTPFHYLGDDGEPEPYPPKAHPAVPATPQPSTVDLVAMHESALKQEAAYQVNTLQAGMHDLDALTASALERREQEQVCPKTEHSAACEVGHLVC